MAGKANIDKEFSFKSVFGFEEQEPLLDELERNFDVIVGMDEHHTAEKGTSMATYGLCGCVAGYIDSPDSNTFFHYSPFGDKIIDLLVKIHGNEHSTLHLFVPGEWQLNEQDKYEEVPKAYYTDKVLTQALASAKERGVDVKIHSYSEMLQIGRRYQGTAWVDENGTVFKDSIAVTSSSEAPSEESQNKVEPIRFNLKL